MSSSMPKSDLNRLHVWIKCDIAARKIQRNFRQWRCLRKRSQLLKFQAYNRMNRLIPKVSLALGPLNSVGNSKPSRHQPLNDDYFTAVVHNSATFDQKMAFWRNVVDMRRDFPALPTETIIKALIEANNDHSKCAALLNTKEFVVQHKHPFPANVRAMFNPDVGPFEHQVLTASDILLRKSNADFLSTINGNEFSEKRKNNIEIIKMLRSQHMQQKKRHLIDVFNDVIAKTYFVRPTAPVPNLKTGKGHF